MSVDASRALRTHKKRQVSISYTLLAREITRKYHYQR